MSRFAQMEASMEQARTAMEAFGSYLRATRSDVGISLRELDAETGIRYSDLARIEHGRVMPTAEQLEILRGWVLQHAESDAQGS